MLPIASFLLVGDGPREALATLSARELAGNGYYEFARAFRNNELDYQTFYITMPEHEARLEMRDEFQEARSASVFTDALLTRWSGELLPMVRLDPCMSCS